MSEVQSSFATVADKKRDGCGGNSIQEKSILCDLLESKKTLACVSEHHRMLVGESKTWIAPKSSDLAACLQILRDSSFQPKLHDALLVQKTLPNLVGTIENSKDLQTTIMTLFGKGLFLFPKKLNAKCKSITLTDPRDIDQTMPVHTRAYFLGMCRSFSLENVETYQQEMEYWMEHALELYDSQREIHNDLLRLLYRQATVSNNKTKLH